MAVIYLRSTDGSDASDGLTWANAKATLAAALTAAGAGGTVYVSDNHAETQAAAMTLASPGTAASPTVVLCVDDTGDPEPPTTLATTGTVSTTGANTITYSGFAYVYGLTFTAGNAGAGTGGHAAGSAASWDFEASQLGSLMTNVNGNVQWGATGGSSDTAHLHLINSTVKFNNASHHLNVTCNFLWQNTASAIQGATLPTTLFIPEGYSGVYEIDGVDFSALGAAKNLIDISTSTNQRYHLQNCKLGSSVSITTGSPASPGSAEVEIVNCDSADTNYRYFRKNYHGEISQETTIVRTGGASDGTTAISRKMVSSANTKFYSPLVSAPIAYWNETTGSAVTATVEIITDNVTLTDAEAWIEVEYLGTSGFPVASFARDRATNILSTPANQTSSTVAWTTTGLTTPVKQKLSTSFTPQEKGVVLIRVFLAKASTTLFFCPKADIT